MKYGILEGDTLTKFKNPTNIIELAKSVLARKLREDNQSLNAQGVLDYMNGWVEWSQDMDEPVTEPHQIVDVAVDTIVYSNAHYIDLSTNIEISNDERHELYTHMVRLIDTFLDKALLIGNYSINKDDLQ